MVEFLSGGGTTGALMRARDWSASPLGPPQTWPQPLKTVVSLVLQSEFPMFVAWGSELGFLYNDSYADILGEKHPQALGRPFHDIWSEIWADISPLIDAAMSGQATFHEDLPLVMNRKGFDEQTWFTFSYSPVRDGSGKVAGMFCACQETTRRVLAERGLRELNETLEQRVSEALAQRRILADIVEGTDAFVQVADLDYRWLAINTAASAEFERIFGKRPHVGECMLDVLADQPEDRKAVEAVWSRALAGEEYTAVAEFGDRDRDRRHYEMRYNTLRDVDGKRIGAYQFAYDVTERLRDQERLRNAEQALRQAQRLESLGQLTGGVAHDFNNLLAVFASGVQLLQRNPSPQQRDDILDAMRRAVTRGTGLTRHLLAFSRRRPVHPESVDLRSHLGAMKEMLASSLRGDVDIEMRFDDDLWPVEVDAGELELAVVNLCVNARDAMPSGGTILLTARNVEPHDGSPGQFVKLAIADTGAGIPSELLTRVFDPFFTTKDVGKGSGLGLAQVYGLAQQSGGRVSIESEVDSGTVVTLLLPKSTRSSSAARDAGVVDRAQVSTNVSVRRGTALLVEDDKEVAALGREMLGLLGFQVIHVSSALAALGALADARSVDVVFSDIMMPGGTSGVELARDIRRRHPGLPIVLATGYAESAAGVGDGEFRVLLKPYSLESLSAALGVEFEHDAGGVEESLPSGTAQRVR